MDLPCFFRQNFYEYFLSFIETIFDTSGIAADALKYSNCLIGSVIFIYSLLEYSV